MEKTYIHNSHSAAKGWAHEGTLEGIIALISKGQILIIVHARSECGFFPGASLIFKSNQGMIITKT